MPTHLQHLLAKRDPGPLFVTAEGRKFVSGAIHQLRHGAATAGGLANVLSRLEEKEVPSHIIRDMIKQAYSLFENVGAAEFAFALTEPQAEIPEEVHKLYIDLFSTIYTKGCEAEEGLRRLCRSTVEIYAPERKHALN